MRVNSITIVAVVSLLRDDASTGARRTIEAYVTIDRSHTPTIFRSSRFILLGVNSSERSYCQFSMSLRLRSNNIILRRDF